MPLARFRQFATVKLPLVGDDFSPDRDLSEEFIAAAHGLGKIAGLE